MADFSVVIIDSREKNSEIYDILSRSKKYSPTIEKLDVGDIMILGRENFLIERKTADDFVGSMIDGSLFEQVRNLVADANANKFIPVLLFIGDFRKTWRFRKISPFHVTGCLNTIQFKFDMKIMRAESEKVAALMLSNLINMYDPEKKKKNKIYPVRKISKKGFSEEDYARCVLEGYPGIAGVRAKRWFDKFGSLKGCIESIENGKMRDIDGIGDGIYSKIKEVYEWEDA